MNNIIFTLIVICCTFFSAVSQNIVLKSGTFIELYSPNKVSSAELSLGEKLRFLVKDDVLSENGKIVISKNTQVLGTVNSVKKAQGVGKEGSLDIVISEILAVDGQNVPVAINMQLRGENKRDEVTKGAVLFFLPALLNKGGEAMIRIGGLITVSTQRNITFSSNKLKNQSRSDLINKEYKELIKSQLDFCGEKPRPPRKLSNQTQFNYKSSSKYVSYQKKLKIWEDCLPYIEN